MTNCGSQQLNRARKFLLAVAGVAALAGPVAVGIVIGIGHAPAARAQAAAAPTPKFEVASIKPCKEYNAPGEGRVVGNERMSPGRLSVNCLSLGVLIQNAYLTFADGHYNPFASREIEKAPGWVGTTGNRPDSDRYYIEAKAEGTPTREMMSGPMMQALLEDRFKLKVHREIREIPVYDLIVAKGGPKLQPFDASCTNPRDFTKMAQVPMPAIGPGDCVNNAQSFRHDDKRYWRGVSIDSLIRAILSEETVGRRVVNKTGLSGLFDIHLEFSHQGYSDRPDSAPSIFDALQEQLGLKLVAATGLGEVLVIDHIERQPSDN
jgi:uncharacterized protein (TIGR03435 family)